MRARSLVRCSTSLVRKRRRCASCRFLHPRPTRPWICHLTPCRRDWTRIQGVEKSCRWSFLSPCLFTLVSLFPFLSCHSAFRLRLRHRLQVRHHQAWSSVSKSQPVAGWDSASDRRADSFVERDIGSQQGSTMLPFLSVPPWTLSGARLERRSPRVDSLAVQCFVRPPSATGAAFKCRRRSGTLGLSETVPQLIARSPDWILALCASKGQA